ncbi:MAG: TolC family protein [Thermodesulfovibrionales bacterium]
MILKTFIISLFVIFIYISPSYSQTSIKLKDALYLALKNNREIQALEESLRAQDRDVSIARSNLFPRITFEERFLRTSNPTYSFMSKLNQARFTELDFYLPNLNHPNPTNDFQTLLSFEQPIFVKKLNVAIDMAKRGVVSKEFELHRKKEEVTYRVMQAVTAIKTIKGFIEVSNKAVQEAEEIKRIADIRYKNNLGLLSDRLRAETSLLEAQQRLLKVEKDLHIAKRALGLLLSKDEPVDILDEDLIKLEVKTLQEYLSLYDGRQDLKGMYIKLDMADKNIEMSKAEYYPVIGIAGSYQMNDHKRPFGSEGESWQILAFLRWNIFDSFKRNHEHQKAIHQKRELEHHLKSLRSQIEYSIHEAYEDYKLLKNSVEIATSNLKTAEEGKRLIKIRYENGLSPIIDLLSAQTVLDSARANLNEKQNSLYLSILNLKLQSGILLKELNLQ